MSIRNEGGKTKRPGAAVGSPARGRVSYLGGSPARGRVSYVGGNPAAEPVHTVSVIERIIPYLESGYRSVKPYLESGYSRLRPYLQSMFARAVGGGAEAPVAATEKEKETTGRVSPLPPSDKAVAYRLLVGSIESESEDRGDPMKTIETWPASRQRLFAAIHDKLSPLLELYGRILPSLESVFAEIKQIGMFSMYGVVYTACVREEDAAADKPPKCWKLPAAPEKSLKLVLKLIKKPSSFKEVVPRYAGYCPRRRYWIGDENPYREVLMGRLLNRLVRRNITPHFPLIYESFEVSGTNMIGFAMETCNIDFKTFLRKVMVRVPDDASRIKLFTVAVLQLTQALVAGQKHYDFRHNDFHAGNAMMTVIVNSSYVYKFNADSVDVAETLYEIPNAGMCWKLIDFGYSSSDVFCAEDNKTQLKTSAALSRMHPTPEHPTPLFEGEDYALEMYDLLRFLFAARSLLADSFYSEKHPERCIAFFTHLCIELKAISLSSPARGTLMGIHDVDVRDLTADDTASDGLLRKFFKKVASPFKVVGSAHKRRVLAAPQHIFDTDAHPFSAREALTGFEAGHFRVDGRGELTAIRGSEATGTKFSF